MQIVEPMGGCRAVLVEGRTLLFGQPPEVIKSLARHDINRIDAVILPDTRERGGVLLNNLEFPLYHFLFISNGLQDGRRLQIVGDAWQIEEALEYLRLTLLGPTRAELEAWGTAPELREEWLNAGEFFALKGADGRPLEVRDLFDVQPFVADSVHLDDVHITRCAADVYDLEWAERRLRVDLTEDHVIAPPYPISPDQVSSNLVTFGLDILGGASGFSVEEASTGMVLVASGKYILIDCIPFLDHHLQARGISKHQISTLLLTHLHDDHCSMFPLLLSSRRVEVISTREIYNMAIIKLAKGLGWREEVVAECFELIELVPGETLRHYGLEIEAHVTVHSIPTIGVTVRTSHLGRRYAMCVVGDNQSFGEIAEMRELGLIRESTEAKLHQLYRAPYDLLVADGGMGVIHGDPADALESQAEQVVFVHVDRLPERFSATFSLAHAGKRYTIVDGEADLYTMRALEFFQANFDRRVPGRWLGALLADKRILRFNRDDVILKEGALSRGNVYLILTGSCEVLVHDGTRSRSVGTREAGDFIGEMAAVTGGMTRNASVIASTPVTVCEFSEETFLGFVRAEGLTESLTRHWGLRDLLGRVPALGALSTTVLERVCRESTVLELFEGDRLEVEPGFWYLVVDGEGIEPTTGRRLDAAAEGGERPLAAPGWSAFEAPGPARLARLPAIAVRALIARVPELSYRLRSYRALHEPAAAAAWSTGPPAPQ